MRCEYDRFAPRTADGVIAWELATRNAWAVRRAGMAGVPVGLDIPGLLALPAAAAADDPDALAAHLQDLEGAIIATLAERRRQEDEARG